MAEHATSASTASTSDPIRTGVLMLVGALSTDFGADRFRQTLGTTVEEQERNLRLWKRRAYARLRRVDPTSIVDGYERCIRERRPYMPKLVELTETIVHLDGLRQHQAAETARLAGGVPKPEQAPSNPGDARSTPGAEISVGLRELAKMGTTLARSEPRGLEGNTRLEAAIHAHAALLARQRAQGVLRLRRVDPAALRCAATGCPHLGTVSLSISGGGLWYCADHARSQRHGGT